MKNRNSRQKKILTYLETKRTATYSDLEQMFNVSNMTIRRDVDDLAQEELLIKTLGGVQILDELYESEILTRISSNKSEKQAIACEAEKYINNGESIYLDGSSTCVELAKKLAKGQKNITVVTNSLLVHLELARGSNLTVICLGGVHDFSSYCLTGTYTEELAKKFYFDKSFFSTKGFFPCEGTFESSVETFCIKQIIAERSSEVILLVDHSKFGQKSLCKVFDISQIHTIFTDDGISQDDRKTLESTVKNVTISHLAEAALNH